MHLKVLYYAHFQVSIFHPKLQSSTFVQLNIHKTLWISRKQHIKLSV